MTQIKVSKLQNLKRKRRRKLKRRLMEVLSHWKTQECNRSRRISKTSFRYRRTILSSPWLVAEVHLNNSHRKICLIHYSRVNKVMLYDSPKKSQLICPPRCKDSLISKRRISSYPTMMHQTITSEASKTCLGRTMSLTLRAYSWMQ